MKKLFSLLGIFVLILVASSCKKNLLPPHPAPLPKIGCIPSLAPCPPSPNVVGSQVLSPVYESNNLVKFGIYEYYVNPNQTQDSSRLESWIGNAKVNVSYLDHVDASSLGIIYFEVELSVDTFHMVVLGYNKNKPCYCDPFSYDIFYGTTNTPVGVDNKLFIATPNGGQISAVNERYLEEIKELISSKK